MISGLSLDMRGAADLGLTRSGDFWGLPLISGSVFLVREWPIDILAVLVVIKLQPVPVDQTFWDRNSALFFIPVYFT